MRRLRFEKLESRLPLCGDVVPVNSTLPPVDVAAIIQQGSLASSFRPRAPQVSPVQTLASTIQQGSLASSLRAAATQQAAEQTPWVYQSLVVYQPSVTVLGNGLVRSTMTAAQLQQALAKR